MKMLLAVCALAVACSPQIDANGRGTASSDLVTSNGENLNGENLNGENLNGENLNGPFSNGPGMALNVDHALFDGATVNGRTLDSVYLDGSMLHGFAGNNELTGFEFDNARFQATLLDGTPLTLRITDVNRPPFGSDVWTYLVQFRDARNNWHPLCLDANNNAIYAIALDGRWNYGRGVPGGGDHVVDPASFTFACKGLGALGKCVSMGYEPWSTLDNGTSLAPYHEACTRALRADYCGDGNSWTVDGRRIDLWDSVGIQQQTRPLWFFEAEWDDTGAACVTNHRVIDLQGLLGTLSPCILSRVSLTCGSSFHFQTGTLLMNRYQSPGISLF
ncbi:MAG: ADYC domain-containing protein [Myxococcales bacterium]